MVCLAVGLGRERAHHLQPGVRWGMWVWLRPGKPMVDFEPGLICLWRGIILPAPFPGFPACSLLACWQLGGCQHFNYSSQLSMVYNSTVKQALGKPVAPLTDLLAYHFYI